jgi:hypothetical protein
VDPLEVASWHWAAGDIRAEDLPDVATDALVRGLDGPALRVLAGENRDDAQGLRDLFALALAELDYPLLDQDSAQWQLIRLIARAIDAGSVDPGDGANQIWRRSFDVAEEGDLRVFVGLASELEDHPSSATTLNEAILVAAADLLARAKPRRWIRVQASPDVSPLGHHDPDGYRIIEIQSEPITTDLMSELKSWNDDFHSVLDGGPVEAFSRKKMRRRLSTEAENSPPASKKNWDRHTTSSITQNRSDRPASNSREHDQSRRASAVCDRVLV